MVVAYHTGGGATSSNFAIHTIGAILKAGWSGVTLFFLLSGFLITGILWDTKGGGQWWCKFYARRALRISPLYYGSLLLILLVAMFDHNVRNQTKGLWIYALYLQNVPWIVDPGSAVRPLQLSHFWSLAVEEQFYMIWPLLIRQARTTAQVKYLCIGVVLSSAAFRYLIWAVSSQPAAFNGFILNRSGELALGGYLAICFRDGSWPRIERIAPYVTVASLFGFIALGAVSGSFELASKACATTGLTFIALFCGGLMVLALRGGFIGSLFKVVWLRWIGKISYGIYVYHVLFAPVYGRIAMRLAPHADRVEGLALRAVVTWALTLGIAWLSYRYFESPILGLRRHFSVSSHSYLDKQFAQFIAPTDSTCRSCLQCRATLM